MKVYVVVTKSNCHQDTFDGVFGVYVTLKQAEDAVRAVEGTTYFADILVEEVEGE